MTDYAMYTAAGNELMGKLVEQARIDGADWPTVFDCLLKLATTEKEYSECCDTEVRAAVYKALGFTTPFYI